MTIEVLNVSKNYNGKPYLKKVSLDISSGSVISVIGPKKSGKTALMRIILGLEDPDGGQITLLGDYKYDRVNAGVVFQDDRLCPGFTAAENVAMVNEKLSVRVARQELNKLLPEGVCARSLLRMRRRLRGRSPCLWEMMSRQEGSSSRRMPITPTSMHKMFDY